MPVAFSYLCKCFEIHCLETRSVAGDAREVITAEPDILHPGVAEGDEDCGYSFAGLEEDEEELEDNEILLDDC